MDWVALVLSCVPKMSPGIAQSLQYLLHSMIHLRTIEDKNTAICLILSLSGNEWDIDLSVLLQAGLNDINL